MKITSIKQQVKDPERVSIFVDGKYSFSLSLSELVGHKLKNNQELSEADIKRLKKISEDGKLKARALNWLLMRPHSEREFRDYLKRKKAEPDLIENWTDEFRERKYLDDKAFAVWFSDNRSRKNKSNRAIKSELFKKGIDREIIDAVLEQSGENEDDRLKALIAKKSTSSRYRSDPLKLAKYLVSQGFNYYLVKQYLARDKEDD
jgi:regulatory protein